MSAHRYTGSRIDCDHEGCDRSEFAELLGVGEPKAARARKILKARGWLVGVPAPEPGGQRADYCPDHAPDPGRIAPEDRKDER